MADFIHISDARDATRIRRNGITPSRKIRVAEKAREMRLDIIGQEPVWQPYDKAVLNAVPRVSRLSPREYDILRGYKQAGLVGYLNNRRSGRAVEYRNVEREVRVVYLMPLVQNRQVAFGWTREIGQKSNAVVAVQVRIPDNEIVYCGFYNGVKREMTAAEAYALVRAEQNVQNAQHFEVVIARRVLPREIRRISQIDKLTGWRHYPTSHGDHPNRFSFSW